MDRDSIKYLVYGFAALLGFVILMFSVAGTIAWVNDKNAERCTNHSYGCPGE